LVIGQLCINIKKLEKIPVREKWDNAIFYSLNNLGAILSKHSFKPSQPKAEIVYE
jgi:hypothetical protein